MLRNVDRIVAKTKNTLRLYLRFDSIVTVSFFSSYTECKDGIRRRTDRVLMKSDCSFRSKKPQIVLFLKAIYYSSDISIFIEKILFLAQPCTSQWQSQNCFQVLAILCQTGFCTFSPFCLSPLHPVKRKVLATKANALLLIGSYATPLPRVLKFAFVWMPLHAPRFCRL